MLKKELGITMAVMLSMGVATADVCEAKSNVLSDILNALTKNTTTSSSSNRNQHYDPSAKRVNLTLDGTYSSIYFDKSVSVKTFSNSTSVT